MENKKTKIKSEIELKRIEKSLIEKAEAGEYKNFYIVAELYERGDFFKKDTCKSRIMYQRFCKEHRKRRVSIDLIEVLLKIGHLYMEEGNKYRAAEAYIEASLQIIQDFKGKERDRAFKKYKIEKYLDKTDYKDRFI